MATNYFRTQAMMKKVKAKETYIATFNRQPKWNQKGKEKKRIY